MKIYCVGGITGLSASEVFGYYDNIKEVLSGMGLDVLHPMVGKNHMRNEEEFKSTGYECSPLTQDNAIFNRDKWMVEHSDIVFADFTRSQDRASIGTCFEIAWANLKGKLVISVIPDGNVHDHLFIKQASSGVFPTTEDALKYIQELTSKEQTHV